MRERFSGIGRFFRRNAFYLVLIVCMSIVGITGYVAQRLHRTPQNKVIYNEPNPSGAIVETPPVIASPIPSKQASVTPQTVTHTTIQPEPQPYEPYVPTLANLQPEPTPAKQITNFIPPHRGEILVAHTPDVPAFYSVTLGDWRVHNGVDIAGKLGDAVVAVAAGTVEKVEDHESLGRTIVISHGNGLKTVYSNLAPSETPRKGDSVTEAQIIGSIGETARDEMGQQAHLHFETILNDENVDPKMYF